MVRHALRKAVLSALPLLFCAFAAAQPPIVDKEVGWQQPYSAGLLFLSWDDFESALRYFDRAIKVNPRDPRPWFHGGFCRGKLGDTEGKFRYYKRAIHLNPRYADPHYSLGISYILVGRHCDAIREYVALKTLDKSLADKLSQLLEIMTDDPHGEQCETQGAPPRAAALL